MIILSDHLSGRNAFSKAWTTALVLYTGSIQPGLPIRITQKAVKNLDAKATVHTIKSEFQGIGPSQP